STLGTSVAGIFGGYTINALIGLEAMIGWTADPCFSGRADNRNSCYHAVIVVVVAAAVVVTTTSPVRSMMVVMIAVAPVTTLLRGGDVNSKEEGSMGNYEDLGDKNFVETDVESVADALDGENGQPCVVDEHDDGFVAKTKEPMINEVLEKVEMNEQPKEKDSFTPKNTSTLHNSESQNGSSIKQSGFSMLKRLEETIKVGLALVLNMKGCEDTLASLVADKGDSYVNKRIVFRSMFKETKKLHVDLWMLRQIWGDTHFNFASTSTLRLSVDGLWFPDDVLIRWIIVYAPQNLSSKIALWSSLSNLIVNWKGPLVTMGDFNKVKEAGKRLGLVFNRKQDEIFNDFILDSSLIDIPLGGYN
nr:RNA-directed DNA polymerase, eukaryota, reverse transcriptase zinc-binding domain protein [Tanacetum cinerariifolium]